MRDLRRATALALAALAVLLLVALRHHFLWGAGRFLIGVELHVWLGIGEGIGLAIFTLLGVLGLRAALVTAPHCSERALLRAGAIVALAAALVPPVLSSDVFDYIARGRVEAFYGRNPYLVPPATFAGTDAVLALAEWPAFVMPYGPVSALLQAACAGIAGATPGLGVYLFKLLCAAAHVGTAWLLARAAPPGRSRTMLALWLFHPWLLLESCASAHNEAVMALFLAWMVERLARDRFAAATLAFGLAVLTKHGCAVLGPVLLALAVRQRRAGAFGAGLAATAAITVLCAWRYFLEPGALDFLSKQTANRGGSLQYFCGLLLGPAAERPLLAAGYALVLGALAVACARAKSLATFAGAGIGVLLLFILLAMPLFSPWYHLWWLPLVALAPASSGGARALHALAWLGPMSYAVYACTRTLDLPHQAWMWLAACAAPIAIARGGTPGRSDAPD